MEPSEIARHCSEDLYFQCGFFSASFTKRVALTFCCEGDVAHVRCVFMANNIVSTVITEPGATTTFSWLHMMSSNRKPRSDIWLARLEPGGLDSFTFVIGHMTSSPLLFVPPPWRPVAAPLPLPPQAGLQSLWTPIRQTGDDSGAGGAQSRRRREPRTASEELGGSFPPPACQDGEESLAKSLQEFSPVEKPLDW